MYESRFQRVSFDNWKINEVVGYLLLLFCLIMISFFTYGLITGD